MTTAVTAVDRYLAGFEALERRSASESPAWLQRLRHSAMERFAEVGFPTTRDEDWRYTSLAPLLSAAFTPGSASASLEPSATTLEQFALDGAESPRLIFVDGRYSSRRSLRSSREGGYVSSLAEAVTRGDQVAERHLARHAGWDADAFAALSTAFVEDGAVLHVPTDAALTAPIELLFVATRPGAVAQPRILVVTGPGSRATIIERYVTLTDQAYFSNVVTEIVVGTGATVEHAVVQEQSESAVHVATVHAAVERDGTFSTCGVTFGGRLARTTLTVQFGGEGGRATLGGLYVLGGSQHVDNHVSVDHAVARCSSRQLYKGVLDGSARAVFNGRILVRPGAQKTDANQTNKHLLLSDTVEVDSKPQLEIFADDVKCTHGAAEGQLAPEALFYLRSRGLGEAAARALLTHGFAHEVVDRLSPASLRRYVDNTLGTRLGVERVR